MRKLTASNLVFLLLTAVFLTAGASLQQEDINKGIVLTELLIVLLPAFVFAGIYKDSTVLEFLKVRSFKPSTIIKAIGITFLTYPVAVFANLVVIGILSVFKQPEIPEVPIASTIEEFVLYIGIIGILPGICEEFLFRGFFMSMNREIGLRNSIFFTGFLFALFHYNIYNFAGPLVLGIVFGYMTVITKSIWPAAICHALNNSIASTLGFWALRNQEGISADSAKALEGISFSQAVAVQIGFWGIFAFLCFKLLKRLMSSLANDYGMRGILQSEEKSILPFLDALPFVPIAVCVAVYIYITAIII